MAHFKVPKLFTFVTEWPQTATVKIQKYVLRSGKAAIAASNLSSNRLANNFSKVSGVLEYVRKLKACIISNIQAKPRSSFQKEKAVVSQQQRLIYIPFVGIIILCLFAVLFLAIRKRFSKSTSSKKVMKHKVETPPDEALKYWTADRMHNTRATPLPEVNNLIREKQDPRPSATQDT